MLPGQEVVCDAARKRHPLTKCTSRITNPRHNSKMMLQFEGEGSLLLRLAFALRGTKFTESNELFRKVLLLRCRKIIEAKRPLAFSVLARYQISGSYIHPSTRGLHFHLFTTAMKGAGGTW